jgi:hypothetical protein
MHELDSKLELIFKAKKRPNFEVQYKTKGSQNQKLLKKLTKILKNRQKLSILGHLCHIDLNFLSLAENYQLLG